MNIENILKRNFILSLINIVIIVSITGCTSSSSGLIKRSASASSMTNKINNNNSFRYSIDIPTGWQIVNSSDSCLELSSVIVKDKDFVNPQMRIFIPDAQYKQPQQAFIGNVLSGTTSNTRLTDITKANNYNTIAYECTQNNTHKEYACYFAFITTDTDFVVMNLSGDINLKEDLKSILLNSLKTFRKN